MLTNNALVSIYKKMIRIRMFEEATVRLYGEALITGSLHSYIGQEAIAATVAYAMKPGDMITSTHRGLGHCIAIGMDMKSLLAELFGKATGCCGGKGGPMHIFDPALGLLGTNGIVAGGTSLAVGAALAAKDFKNSDAVVFCFFGEGASNEGVTHESMNLSSVWKLPVIFVCENNSYQVFTHESESCSVRDIALRAQGYGMPGITTDGNDVVKIAEALQPAIDRARSGDGPSLVECKTYRWTGHWPGDIYSYGGYRTTEEVDEWKKKCPIDRLGRELVGNGVITPDELEKMRTDVERELEEAIAFAKDSPEPDAGELMKNLFMEGTK